MVIEVLAADTVTMRVRIVSPAEDARVRDISREEIAEPVHAVRRRPGLVAVSVQAMDSYNAGECWWGLSGCYEWLTLRPAALPPQ